jgi:hypothetical protein
MQKLQLLAQAPTQPLSQTKAHFENMRDLRNQAETSITYRNLTT